MKLQALVFTIAAAAAGLSWSGPAGAVTCKFDTDCNDGGLACGAMVCSWAAHLVDAASPQVCMAASSGDPGWCSVTFDGGPNEGCACSGAVCGSDAGAHYCSFTQSDSGAVGDAGSDAGGGDAGSDAGGSATSTSGTSSTGATSAATSTTTAATSAATSAGTSSGSGSSSSGCGCRIGSGGSSPVGFAGLALAGVLVAARRRRSR